MVRNLIALLSATLVGIALVLTLATPISAYDQSRYSMLQEEFDARGLTYREKRFLQTALAMSGDYNGLLDGAWGRISQQALDAYALREFGETGRVWHMSTLALGFVQAVERDGWEIQYFDRANFSLLMPMAALVEEPATDGFLNWRHLNSSLRISATVSVPLDMVAYHRFVEGRSASPNSVYAVRKDHLYVTSVRDGKGDRSMQDPTALGTPGLL